MKQRLIATLLRAWAVVMAGTANADPTPPPSPGYVIQGRAGPTVGGLRTLPPVCAVQPLACDLRWNPNTGAFEAPPE